MKIERHKRNDTLAEIVFSGKFNIESVTHFNDIFYDLIHKSFKQIIINCKELIYIDSSGIGAMIRAANVAKKANIDFLLYGIQEDVFTILQQACVDRFFTMTDTLGY